ncbi:MAG: hypothetical protein RLZZ302_232, partial [Actinomycetota bacterium]
KSAADPMSLTAITGEVVKMLRRDR